jgi:N-acetylated-alpha-linked acidic dipeptidase
MRHAARTALLLVPCALTAAQAADEARLAGFTPEGSAAQRALEEKFQGLPSPANMRAYMERISARPHHVGSAYDKDNAEWLLARFKEWGWDAHIETFDVLFPTPQERVLEMIEPVRFTPRLREPALSVDPTSSQAAEQLPTYNAYSADGDVSGPLVYVNYGLPRDYEELERLGVSVTGAIVIARYGQSWRGIKPKVAAEHGAVGCLIYSDPRDDGYFEDETFPTGPMRPRDGVQRGSVMDFAASNPGDPLTPGVGATPDARRLAVKDAPSVQKIPVLPISWGDAQPLLAAVKGPMAPTSWRGALPIPYHVGPGPARVHLRLKFSWDLKPVRDVVATLQGAVEPDQWVVRGNHHDAWVNGADDPVSGLVPFLEEARALGELVKQGWRPRRTIVYCAWDGEEPMLLGSTEWAEAHARELQQRAVAYINSDGNRRGYLSMGGSHTLERFINGVARSVQDPEAQVSVFERERLRRIGAATSPERDAIRKRHDLRIDALGSGTDFTAFLDHLGVASLDLAYQGEDLDGIYHSIYDDFYWYSHFSDTDFVYGRALAQTAGLAVLRLADAEVLPFDFTGLADTVRTYLKELTKLATDAREAALERNRQLDEGLFRATVDPRHPTLPPSRAEIPPFLNFAPLENALARLESSAGRYQAAVDKAALDKIKAAQLTELNRTLIQSERRLLTAQGLPRRPWYKHVLYAPGVYTGYAVKTVPGVREAIEQKRWAEAEAEVARAATALVAESELVDAAADLLERGAE